MWYNRTICMIEEYEMNPLLNGMNDRQAEAVQTTEGPLLIMAELVLVRHRVLDPPDRFT